MSTDPKQAAQERIDACLKPYLDVAQEWAVETNKRIALLDANAYRGARRKLIAAFHGAKTDFVILHATQAFCNTADGTTQPHLAMSVELNLPNDRHNKMSCMRVQMYIEGNSEASNCAGKIFVSDQDGSCSGDISSPQHLRSSLDATLRMFFRYYAPVASVASSKLAA